MVLVDGSAGRGGASPGGVVGYVLPHSGESFWRFRVVLVQPSAHVLPHFEREGGRPDPEAHARVVMHPLGLLREGFQQTVAAPQPAPDCLCLLAGAVCRSVALGGVGESVTEPAGALRG